MPDIAAPEIDHTRAEAFALRMVGVLNDASLALMMSIGHRVGLAAAIAAVVSAANSRS